MKREQRWLILDNEALEAVASPAHAKHRAVMAMANAVRTRNRRTPGSAQIATTTAVRVEAALDRRSPGSAELGRLRIHDVALDGTRADLAAQLHRLGGSVVDATVAELALSLADNRVTVLTSDLTDLPTLLSGTRVTVHLV